MNVLASFFCSAFSGIGTFSPDFSQFVANVSFGYVRSRDERGCLIHHVLSSIPNGSFPFHSRAQI